MRRNLDRQGPHIADEALARLRTGGEPGFFRYSNDHYALIALPRPHRPAQAHSCHGAAGR